MRFYLGTEEALEATKPTWPPAITDALILLRDARPGWPFSAPSDLEARVAAIVALCPGVRVWPSFWIGGANIISWSDLHWVAALDQLRRLAKCSGVHGVGIDLEVGQRDGPMPRNVWGGQVAAARVKGQAVAAALAPLPIAACVWWDDLAKTRTGMPFAQALANHTTLYALDEGPYVAGGSSHHFPAKARPEPGIQIMPGDDAALRHGTGGWVYDPKGVLMRAT